MREPSWLALHGFLGAPAAWDAVRSYGVPGRWITPWLPGHGPSRDDRSLTSWDALQDALAARWIDAHDGPLWAVGYSLGARVALDLVARRPSRFAGAVLVGVNPSALTEDERRQRLRDDEAQASALEREGVAAFVTRWESLPLFATQAALPEPVRAQQRAWRAGHDAEGLAYSLRAHGLGAMRDRASTLRDAPCPAWLVTGSMDEKFSLIAEGYRSSRVRVLRAQGAGHNVPLEAPEALARVLVDALKEAS